MLTHSSTAVWALRAVCGDTQCGNWAVIARKLSPSHRYHPLDGHRRRYERFSLLGNSIPNDVADRGWARHLGVSNFTVAQMEAISGCSERPIVCNQVENHPFLDQTRIRETCSRLGMALIGYCPLYRGDGLFDHSVVREIIADTGATPAQVVLAWHFHHAGSGAIPKTATVSRLAENLAALDVSLNAQQMDALNGLMVKQHRLCQYDFSPEWDPV